MFTIENTGSGDYSFIFDRDDIPFHSGACDTDISYFREAHQSEFEKISRDDCIEILASTGGWNKDELAEWVDDELFEAVLWVAAGDARENEDAYPEEDTVEGAVSTY